MTPDALSAGTLGLRLRFSVSDTGIGMTTQAKEQIFTRFSQVDVSMTRRFGGTGLGLTIAQQLCRLMGGEIEVESTPGKGSTFCFTVQLEPGPAESDAASRPHLLEGVRVLVVDDNEAYREILLQTLNSWGMRGEAAGSGFQALELFRAAAADPFRYLIVDLQMPGMDGIQTALAIRDGVVGSEPRIIMLTPSGGLPDRPANHAAGIDAYLSKPVRQSHLLNSLLAIENHDTRVQAYPAEPPSRYRFSARVLLVEDAPVNLDVGTWMLEALGCRVDTAGNGLEALDAVAGTRYDLVLMDCQMPEMDGYQATRRLREREAEGWAAPDGIPAGRLTVIALTAHAMPNDRQLCLDAGMDDYLAKPFTRDALGAVLFRWLPTAPPGLDAPPEAPGVAPAQAAGLSPAEKPAGCATQAADRTTLLLPEGRGREGGKPGVPLPRPSPSRRGQGYGGPAGRGDSAPRRLDMGFIDELRALQCPGKPDLLEKVITQYLADGVTLVATIRSGLTAGDAAAVQCACHRFKSSSAFVGATWLAQRCEELDRDCRDGRLPLGTDSLSGIEEGFREARSGLELLLLEAAP